MTKFAFQHTYKYPWELVTHTHLTKYPNEKEKNILDIEYIQARKGKLKQLAFHHQWRKYRVD